MSKPCVEQTLSTTRPKRRRVHGSRTIWLEWILRSWWRLSMKHKIAFASSRLTHMNVYVFMKIPFLLTIFSDKLIIMPLVFAAFYFWRWRVGAYGRYHYQDKSSLFFILHQTKGVLFIFLLFSSCGVRGCSSSIINWSDLVDDISCSAAGRSSVTLGRNPIYVLLAKDNFDMNESYPLDTQISWCASSWLWSD